MNQVDKLEPMELQIQKEANQAITDFAVTTALKDEEADDCFGEFKGFFYGSRLMDVHAVLLLDRIKTEKLYKRRIDPQTKKPYKWADVCPKRLGISRGKADEMIGMFHQYGRAFIEALQGIRLPRQSVRLMLQAPADLQADVLAIQEAPEDERQQYLDKLVGQISEQAGVVEDLGETIEARNAEIDKRKKSEAKREDELRAVRRQLREAQAEYVPSEDETDAANELAIFDAQLRAAHRRICAQIEAMPDSPDVLTIGKGIRDNLVQLADDLGGVLVEAINKQAKGKQ